MFSLLIQGKVIQRVVGILLALFSFTLFTPLMVGVFFGDPLNSITPFIGAFIASVGTGLLLYLPVKNHTGQLRLRDGFLVVVLFWAVLGIFGSLPFYFYSALDLSLAGAIFESMSGLTTTGATVIVGLDQLPRSILFYRQQMQWLGGMGIIVLAIAVLPMLGIGGQQLFRAETPGISKEKLTPRIAGTAKALWYIYLGLTITCALAYWAAGMSGFDAIGHSFSTVAIGGFSTHDNSIGYFDSTLIEMIAVVFMLISGVNFALHFTATRQLDFKPYWYKITATFHPIFKKKRRDYTTIRDLDFKQNRRDFTKTLHLDFKQYWRDEEFRAYVWIALSLTIITSSYLYLTHTADGFDAVVTALFHVVSIGTTTGFTSEEYFNWPGFLPVLLLFASFAGGCAGSTGGGMKVIRVLLLFKQGQREIRRLIHPHATIMVKVGGQAMSNRMIDVVWGFFASYLALLAIMLLLLMAAGLDQETAFSAVVACLNNLGPGLGKVAANYSSLDDFSLSVLSLAMLFGRLEIFTLLVLFTPTFWRP